MGLASGHWIGHTVWWNEVFRQTEYVIHSGTVMRDIDDNGCYTVREGGNIVHIPHHLLYGSKTSAITSAIVNWFPKLREGDAEETVLFRDVILELKCLACRHDDDEFTKQERELKEKK